MKKSVSGSFVYFVCFVVVPWIASAPPRRKTDVQPALDEPLNPENCTMKNERFPSVPLAALRLGVRLNQESAIQALTRSR